MKQAMNTLCQFSEKERNYFAYQARQDFLRQQGTILFEKDEAAINFTKHNNLKKSAHKHLLIKNTGRKHRQHKSSNVAVLTLVTN